MTWQEKFDKLMPSEVVTDRDYYNPWKNDIKQFISQAIEQTKKETREETIKEIEESLPTFLAGELYDDETKESRSGRNKALREVRDIFNKLKK